MVFMKHGIDARGEAFEGQRQHLFMLAYRMLGTVDDAQDVVQDVWLRWQAADRSAVRNARAWFTTTATHLAIDHLRAARVRRAEYVGCWLPEPLLSGPEADPGRAHERSEEVSLALMLALERLGPQERVAFLMREVFEVDYSEIATMLDRSEASCRQLVKRARARVADDRPRFETSPEEHAHLVRAFTTAIDQADTAALESLLGDEVELWSDGGGKVAALRKPQLGRPAVLRALTGLARIQLGPIVTEERNINGRLGLLLQTSDGTRTLLSFRVRAQRITGFYLQRNPDKLRDIYDIRRWGIPPGLA